MKFLITGLGSIGKRHAEVLRKNGFNDIYAIRSGVGEGVNSLGIPEVYSWEEVDEISPDIALITNPTALHIPAALECAKRGMHIFMEKPLSHDMEGVEELENICREKSLACYVAYCMRFHPVINKIIDLIKGEKVMHVRVVCSSFLPDWRAVSDWRRIYSSSKSMGGGVILDLSHEFDYIEYIFSPIKTMLGSSGRVGDVTIDAEDYADVLMELDNGINVNLFINFMSHYVERKIIVDMEDGFMEGDIYGNRISYYKNKVGITYYLECEDIFSKQLKYFLGNLGGETTMNGIDESKRLLKKIVDFKKKINL